jgi:hypothetical protein
MDPLKEAMAATCKTMEQIIADSFQGLSIDVIEVCPDSVRNVAESIRITGKLPSYVKTHCRRILQERDEAVKSLGIEKEDL